MPEVIIHDDENFERALKRFEKKCEKPGILSDLRKHRHYEKPSERRGSKRRRESAEQYAAAGPRDLADRELAEVKMLEEFLPAAVDPEEIRQAVRDALAAGAKDLGGLMGQVMPKFKGRADGKLVNQIAREELAAIV